MSNKNTKSQVVGVLGGAVILLSTGGAFADSVSVTNIFSAATPARASEVNQNFTDVEAAVNDNDARITALESVSGGGGAVPENIDCSTASSTAIQDAVDSGVKVINLSGSCTENVLIDTDDVSLIGDGTAILTAIDNTTPALAIDGARRIFLNNLTVTGGSNSIHIVDGASVFIEDVTVNGAVAGPAALLPTGVGVFASTNSILTFAGGNTISGDDGDTSSVLLLAGVQARIKGSDNVFNIGAEVAGELPVAVDLFTNSTLLQFDEGTGNQINGSISVEGGSKMFLQSVAINGEEMGVYDSSSISLQPQSTDAITVVLEAIEIGSSSLLDMGDEGFPVTINNAGVDGVMRLLDHSTLGSFSNNLINMDVELFRGSSIDASSNTTIGGNLSVNGFSSVIFTGIVASAVLGNVSCNNSEANEFDIGDAFSNLCP